MYIGLFPEEKLYLQWTFSRGVIILTTSFFWGRNPIFNGLFPGVIIFTSGFYWRSNPIYNGLFPEE